MKKHIGSPSVVQISLRYHPPNHKRVEENAFISKSKRSPRNPVFEGCLLAFLLLTDTALLKMESGL